MATEKNEIVVKKGRPNSKAKKVLVIVDMQNDFCTGVLGNDMTKAVIPKVVKKLRTKYANYDAIYLTRDIHFDNYFETLEGKKLPIPHCLDDSEGKNIVPELWEAVQDVRSKGRYVRVINKHTFASKTLVDYIAATCGSADEVELCGVCTDICVVSNAITLRAELPNTVIKVDALCCAGTSMKAHNAALRTMNSCQIDIIGRKYGKNESDDTAESEDETVSTTAEVTTTEVVE